MSPENRALKRVAMVVASALGVSVLISVMTMFITPMILVGILLTFGMTYLLIAVYEMFVAQEKIKDNLK